MFKFNSSSVGILSYGPLFENWNWTEKLYMWTCDIDEPRKRTHYKYVCVSKLVYKLREKDICTAVYKKN